MVDLITLARSATLRAGLRREEGDSFGLDDAGINACSTLLNQRASLLTQA